MNITLVAIGSRGDIEPLLAIGEKLTGKGHSIRCIFPEQFRASVEQIGYPFTGLDPRFMDLILGPDGQALIGGKGSLWKKTKTLFRLIKDGASISSTIIKEQHYALQTHPPDLVIYHFKCLYCTIWGLDPQQDAIALCPFPALSHPTETGGPINLRGQMNKGKYLNKKLFKFINGIKAISTYWSTRKYHDFYPKADISIKSIYRSIKEGEKTIYPISPSLYPRPDSWPSTVLVSGFLERNKQKSYIPEQGLLDFLNTFPKFLFASFGSMANGEPVEKTKILLDSVQHCNIPVLINTSWGGLDKIKHDYKQVYFTKDIPYDYILPKAYAIMHHGGAGTTHTGLKFACPTLIIPHAVDQYLWNSIIAKKALGPKGVPIEKLNVTFLNSTLPDLFQNPQYLENVHKQAINMSKEEANESWIDWILET